MLLLSEPMGGASSLSFLSVRDKIPIFSPVPLSEPEPELVLSRQSLISEKCILLFPFHGLAAPLLLGMLFLAELHEIKGISCQFPRLWWAAGTQPDPSNEGTSKWSLYLAALLPCLATGISPVVLDLC